MRLKQRTFDDMWLRSTCAALLLLLVGTLDATSTFQRHLPPPVDPETGGKLWVVLAAGSDSYYNYRHQADICHAYQVRRGQIGGIGLMTALARFSFADREEPRCS